MKDGPLTEANMSNKVPSWDTIIHTKGEQKHMFLAMLKEAPQQLTNSVDNWPARDLDGGSYGGKLDGVGAGDAKHREYGHLSNAAEQNEEVWEITKRAANTATRGIPANQQRKEEKAAALNRLKNGLEMMFLSEQDAATQAGETPFKCRGIGKILAASGHAATYPIAEEFRVQSNCIFTDPLDAFTETQLRTLMTNAASDREEGVVLDGYLGPLLKNQMDDFGVRDDQASATNAPVRQFTQSGRDGEFVNMIDVFKFSVGIVRTHLCYRLFRDSSGAKTSVISDAGGYFLDMAKYRIAFMQKILHADLDTRNAGESGVYDYIATLRYGVPRGQIMVRPSALVTG